MTKRSSAARKAVHPMTAAPVIARLRREAAASATTSGEGRTDA